ncbi:hypothetical protein [Streptomyces sp. NBC_01443]|uniref:hypothetical protein n=1 Tax=Streptomyces sp. NBC_01443 TaxID=2903868 RepID=UPI0022518A08|nr:hypothetical protein [Streptomyces sp. NBC_01443]MCX4632918.1 hypothetical protein [Streptomyces sp. NBC_01443]
MPARPAGAKRQVTTSGCTTGTATRPTQQLHPAGTTDGEAHLRVRRVEELRQQLRLVLHFLEAVPLPHELGQTVAEARVWLEEITPANPSRPAPAFVRALEHTVRITQDLLARHTVAATYVHLATEQSPWGEHERLEVASARHCRHVAVRRHDVAMRGWPLDQRPVFAQLRDDIEEGRVQLLVVRSTADLLPSATGLEDQKQSVETITAWLYRHRARLLCADQVTLPSHFASTLESPR